MTADTYSSPSHYHLSNQLLSRTARVAHLSDDQTKTTNIKYIYYLY